MPLFVCLTSVKYSNPVLESIDLLININHLLAEHVEKIAADEIMCRAYFDKSPMIMTALLPIIGYEKAMELIEEFNKESGKTVRSFIEEKLGSDLTEKVFSPYHLTALGFKNYEHDSKRK